MTKYIKEKFKGNKDQIALYIAENIEVSEISYSSNLDELQDTFKLGFTCDKNTFTLNRTSDDMLEITYNKPITLYTKLPLIANTYISKGIAKVTSYINLSINDIRQESDIIKSDDVEDVEMYSVDDKGHMELIWTHEDGLI